MHGKLISISQFNLTKVYMGQCGTPLLSQLHEESFFSHAVDFKIKVIIVIEVLSSLYRCSLIFIWLYHEVVLSFSVTEARTPDHDMEELEQESCNQSDVCMHDVSSQVKTRTSSAAIQ